MKKLKGQYIIINGSAKYYGNKIIILEKKSLIINKILDISNHNTFFSYIKPNTSDDCGLIFGFNYNQESYLNNKNYYAFLIKKNGYLSLIKVINNITFDLFPMKDAVVKNFNKYNIYKMTIKFDLLSGDIFLYINDEIIFITNDSSFKGNKVGLISDGIGAEFTQILSE